MNFNELKFNQLVKSSTFWHAEFKLRHADYKKRSRSQELNPEDGAEVSAKVGDAAGRTSRVARTLSRLTAGGLAVKSMRHTQ